MLISNTPSISLRHSMERAKRRRLLDDVREDQQQQQEEEEEQQQQGQDDDDFLDGVELPSGVEAAVLFLRQQFLHTTRLQQLKQHQQQQQELPPLVLVSQLSSIVKDKHAVEVQVEELRQANKVRMLKLSTGVDEHGLLLTSDYVRIVREAAQRAAERRLVAAQQLGAAHGDGDGSDGDDGRARQQAAPQQQQQQQQQQSEEEMVAEVFCAQVVPVCVDVGVASHRLLALMRTLPPPAAAGGGGGGGGGLGLSRVASMDDDKLLSTLLQLGVLARHPVDTSYLFCCPGLGPVIKSVLAGRKELLSLVSRKPKGEVPERTLLGNSLLLHHLGSTSSSSRGAGGGGAGAAVRPVAPALEGGFLRTLVIEIPVQPGQAAAEQRQGTAAAAPTKGSLGVRLKQSVLGVAFHLRDLLGRGDLVRVEASGGVLIRVNVAANGRGGSRG